MRPDIDTCIDAVSKQEKKTDKAEITQLALKMNPHLTKKTLLLTILIENYLILR